MGCSLSPSAMVPKKGLPLGNRSVQDTLASRYVGANAPSVLAEVIVT
ncbi:MAG: hypothetical protein FJZ00_00505, partial [Candidatus Sericytochromatia bacterium]|nr:hypothetical protein [Candidatus Tanganyikabacteria bacterium]